MLIESGINTVITLGHYEVKGVKYGHFTSEERLLNLSKRTKIDLEPEPTNRYDRDAIKIMVKGNLLGYIPKTNTWLFHSLLSQFNSDKLKLTIISVIKEQFKVILKCELII